MELPLTNLFLVNSVYIIICITVNRYIAIYEPFKFQKIHTLKNARLCLSFSFICSFLLHIPFCFRNKVVEDVCSNPSNTSSISTTSTASTTGVDDPDDHDDHEDYDACGWKSVQNIDVADTQAFEAYLVISQILNRIGPIVVLAILNTMIVCKFLRISRELEVTVPGAGAVRKNRHG